MLGNTVTLVIHGKDRYRRLLAMVFAPPRFVNYALVRAWAALLALLPCPESGGLD